MAFSINPSEEITMHDHFGMMNVWDDWFNGGIQIA